MNPDCQNVRELMDSYLSEELSVETNHQVLRHLGACPSCASELTRRQRVRSLLVRSLDVPLDIDRARHRVVAAVHREQGSWRRRATWLTVAATLAVAFGAALWIARPVDAAAYDDSAGDHVACALAYPAGVTYDPARAARNLTPPFERIAEAIGLSHGGYHVIDAHMCPYKGRNYAHLVFRGQGQTLSIFMEPAVRGSLPSTSVRSAIGRDMWDVHSTTRMGYHIDAVATSRHQVFLVSSHQTDPPEIASAILESAVRFVRELEQ